MPVTYHVDPASGTVHTQVAGKLDADDVRAHIQDLVVNPACPVELFVLIDASGLEMLITPELIRVTASELTRVRERFVFRAVAVVVSGTAQYGMFRMGQFLLEPHLPVTNVFHGRAEAEVWLEGLRAERT
jgi:hypothetical protein